MENKIAIAEKRYDEMEARYNEFMKEFKETGNTLSLELAQVEKEDMDKLMTAIMSAKRAQK